MSISIQPADLDPIFGTDRSITWRPVGVLAPKRVDLKRTMRGSTACHPASRMQVQISHSRTGSKEHRDSG